MRTAACLSIFFSTKFRRHGSRPNAATVRDVLPASCIPRARDGPRPGMESVGGGCMHSVRGQTAGVGGHGSAETSIRVRAGEERGPRRNGTRHRREAPTYSLKVTGSPAAAQEPLRFARPGRSTRTFLIQSPRRCRRRRRRRPRTASQGPRRSASKTRTRKTAAIHDLHEHHIGIRFGKAGDDASLVAQTARTARF